MQTLKHNKISDRIIKHLENNPNRLIDRKELVTAGYGNAVNLSFKKRYIDNCLYKIIKPHFQDKGFEVKTLRRVGVILVKN